MSECYQERALLGNTNESSHTPFRWEHGAEFGTVSQVNPMVNDLISPIQSPRATSSIDETLAKYKEDLNKMSYETFGPRPRLEIRMYHKTYPEYNDTIAYPEGYKVPDFCQV